MKLYNTLTRRVNDLSMKEVRIYSCGPTVYNFIHIGNARALIIVDLLIRFLEFNDVNVYYVQNITDIDDKIINKAIELNKSEKEISEFYIKAFKSDLKTLGLRLPNLSVKVSDFILEIIEFIEDLIKKDAAYISNGNVYFNISKYKNEYGKLSKNRFNELLFSNEIKFNDNKINKFDFVLWKKTDIGVKYGSPWSKGRPGWHTECALLIDKFFNHKTIDIHLGGIDLVFPHHENERIQYMAKNNLEISKIWVHNGHLKVDNKKMSKSLNNVITLREYVKKYGINSYKYLIYSTNYLHPLNITREIIEYSSNKVKKIFNLLKKINIYLCINNITLDLNNHGEYLKKVNEQLSNNLNTSNVLAILDELMKAINVSFVRNNISVVLINDFYNIIFNLLNFSFDLPIITPKILRLLDDLENAKRDKNFFRVDVIRKKLLRFNIL